MLKTSPIYMQLSQQENHEEQLLYDQSRIIICVLILKESRSEKITMIKDRQIVPFT
jgi:hypothetical protein